MGFGRALLLGAWLGLGLVGCLSAWGFFALIGTLASLHGEADAFAVRIDLQDGDGDLLLHLDDVGWVLNELVGQFADVDQAILVHTDVHKGPELGNVGDKAGQGHAGFGRR